MRLDKYISTLTDLSRKDVKAALKYGRISVDGVPARDPAMQVDERTATVTLDGATLMFKRHTHIMMNKPAGVLTATEDRAQKTVLDILPDSLRPRDLGPIGRLDKDTTGLLLLSTDGQLAHRLISPRHHVDKEYMARVDGVLDESEIEEGTGEVLTQITEYKDKPKDMQFDHVTGFPLTLGLDEMKNIIRVYYVHTPLTGNLGAANIGDCIE